MFEIDAPVWVKGTVVRYEPVNPHVIIALDEATDEGIVRRWLVEGPSLRRLGNMNVEPDFIKAGDVIEVCGFPPIAQFAADRPDPGTPGYPPQAFHGHVLSLPDGQMRHWGPYGKIENCIRSDDEVQTWVDFLNADPMARTAWCSSRRFVWADSVAPQAFVAEVDRELGDPCE